MTAHLSRLGAKAAWLALVGVLAGAAFVNAQTATTADVSTTTVTKKSASAVSEGKTVTALCPEGRRATGGGHLITGPGANAVTVLRSEPSNKANGRSWRVIAVAPGNTEAWTLASRVVCGA